MEELLTASAIVPNPTIKPLANRVVVRPLVSEKRTRSGIIIPDTAAEKPLRGVVVAVGSGAYIDALGVRRPLEIAIGDHVLYGKHAGTNVELEGYDYLIMFEGDVQAVVPAA